MAISLVSKVWAIDMQTGRKFVLVALCDAANDDGACFVCVETIAYKCGLSIRAVQGHLIDLAKSGLISREERSGRSSIYTVNVDALDAHAKHEFWERRQMMKKTPAKSAGVQNLHPLTPAESAPTPAESAHPPAESAPITVTYPSPNVSLKAKAKTSPLPIDFVLTDSDTDFAVSRCVALTEFDSFVNYHRAKGSRMACWHAAWRTWVLNAVKFAAKASSGSKYDPYASGAVGLAGGQQ